MITQTKSPKMTLEEIAQRKQEVLSEIRKQKQQLTGITQELFTPFVVAASTGNAIMKRLHIAMNIFDGAMMGLNLIRKFRRMLNNK